MPKTKKGANEGLDDPIESEERTLNPELSLLPGADPDDWDITDMKMPDNEEGGLTTENIQTMPPEDAEEAELRAAAEAANKLAEESEDDSDEDDEEDSVEDSEEDETEESEDVDDTDVADTDEDDDSEGEDDDDTDDESEDNEPKIPKHRFDEVNRKRKEAEAELARLRAQQEALSEEEEAPAELEFPEDEFDYDTAEDQYQDAVLEGRKEEARALRKQMREAELAYQRRVAHYEASRVTSDTSRLTNIQQTALTIETAHPEFNSKAEGYNAEITQEAVQLSEAYMSMEKYRNKPEKALLDASTQVLKIYGIVDAQGNRLDAESEAPSPKSKKANSGEVKRKVKAANAQPPKPKRKAAATKEAAIDLDNMTEAEWSSLPESTKARLRGDYRV